MHHTAKIFPVLLVYCNVSRRTAGTKLDERFKELDGGHADVLIKLKTAYLSRKRRGAAFPEFGGARQWRRHGDRNYLVGLQWPIAQQASTVAADIHGLSEFEEFEAFSVSSADEPRYLEANPRETPALSDGGAGRKCFFRATHRHVPNLSFSTRNVSNLDATDLTYRCLLNHAYSAGYDEDAEPLGRVRNRGRKRAHFFST